MNIKKKLAIGGLAAITALAAYKGYRDMESIRNPVFYKAIQNGQVAPEISTVDLNGADIKLSGLEDKLVLLDFFSTNCGSCKELTPDLARLYTECKDNLEVVMIGTMNQETDALKAYSAKLPFKVVQDVNNKIKNEYGVNGIPHLVLIENGKVVEQMTGYGPMCIRWLDKIKKKIKK